MVSLSRPTNADPWKLGLAACDQKSWAALKQPAVDSGGASRSRRNPTSTHPAECTSPVSAAATLFAAVCGAQSIRLLLELQLVRSLCCRTSRNSSLDDHLNLRLAVCRCQGHRIRNEPRATATSSSTTCTISAQAAHLEQLVQLSLEFDLLKPLLVIAIPTLGPHSSAWFYLRLNVADEPFQDCTTHSCDH